jgi:hypothetical protein
MLYLWLIIIDSKILINKEMIVKFLGIYIIIMIVLILYYMIKRRDKKMLIVWIINILTLWTNIYIIKWVERISIGYESDIKLYFGVFIIIYIVLIFKELLKQRKEGARKEIERIEWNSFILFPTYSIIWRIMRGGKAREDNKFWEIWGGYYELREEVSEK